MKVRTALSEQAFVVFHASIVQRPGSMQCVLKAEDAMGLGNVFLQKILMNIGSGPCAGMAKLLLNVNF